MKYVSFTTVTQLTAEAVHLLREHMQIQSRTPHAIMLSGGQTPLPVYKSITENPFLVSNMLHLMMSDERMVPEDSPENNLSKISSMIAALEIQPTRILKVHTDLPHQTAAGRYDKDISVFFSNKGRLTLAMLGLGTDGHTASIFTTADLTHASDNFAIAVKHAKSSDRVSVTPKTIILAEKIVFLAAGRKKAEIVLKLRNNPDSVIAGQVVNNASNIELWFAES